MSDFLTFKRMITPIIIQILFWLAVIASIIGGLFTILGGVIQLGSRQPTSGLGAIVIGVLIILFGPIIARIYAEILIILFRMNETLTDISHALAKPEQTTPKT